MICYYPRRSDKYMGNKDFTFLTVEQLDDSKYDIIDIINKRGTATAITDFTILLGGNVFAEFYIANDLLEGMTGYYWTKTSHDYDGACLVEEDGFIL